LCPEVIRIANQCLDCFVEEAFLVGHQRIRSSDAGSTSEATVRTEARWPFPAGVYRQGTPDGAMAALDTATTTLTFSDVAQWRRNGISGMGYDCGLTWWWSGTSQETSYFFFPSLRAISSTIFGRMSARTLSTMLAISGSESREATSSGLLSAPAATAIAALS